MGFSSVYRVLQEVFPQVDSRVLKAVAIEHSKDADVAVEVVLLEIIPNLPKKQPTVGSLSSSKSLLGFYEGGGEIGQLESAMDNLVINSCDHEPEKSTETCVASSIGGSSPGAAEALDTAFSAQVNSHTVIKPINLEELPTPSRNDANGETTAECSRSLETLGDNNGIIHESGSSDNHGEGCVKNGCENVDNGTLVVPVGNQLVGSSDNHGEGCVKNGCENVDNGTLVVPVGNQLVGTCETNSVATQESDPSSSKPASVKDAFAVEFTDSDDESDSSHVLARSEDKCTTEFLEEIIEDAKNNKKTLVLAMSSVVDLMREVESKEKAVDQAKEEATKGCSDILAKVDEVKQTLLRAKEANDMHAGEVYAEKAILATELKELQHRLMTLSDERNKSLAILDEMRKALENRLATALDEIAAAEERKLENERAAREELLHQESLMEKVVEESKKLKLQAEENSKLQEFLMDRGRAIDILQGEIYVKCQDVLLLKEKFDKGIPLSRSFSSSQTSSILASSGSSFRSVITPLEPEAEPEPETETYESLMKSAEMGGSYGFLEKSSRSDDASQPPKSPEETVNPIDDLMVLEEDGWDLLDK